MLTKILKRHSHSLNACLVDFYKTLIYSLNIVHTSDKKVNQTSTMTMKFQKTNKTPPLLLGKLTNFHLNIFQRKLSFSLLIVYDGNQYFGLCLIPKLKPKMADTVTDTETIYLVTNSMGYFFQS